MAGGGEKTPANSAQPRKAHSAHGSVQGRSSERQKQGGCTFSPSVSSKDSLQQLVTPVQPSKSVDSRSSPCSARSVGSDSGAAPFDICMSGNKCTIKLNPPLFEINRDKRRDMELSKDVSPLQYLRPGMVLLKKFIKPNDQVKIVKVCRQLGVGSGGFYRPGYRHGAKLKLWMMCMGKNWDPDSCSYGDTRPFDSAQPPAIPEEFRKYVQDAIEASHELLKQRIGAVKAVEELPLMSPDVCLVNFYNSSGRLGLHQDKDESRSSLDKGVPVVSFSLGETTEFLVGGCSYSREVWWQILRIWHWQQLCPTLDEESLSDWWLSSRKQMTKMTRKSFDSLVLLTSWMIWKERNSRTFDGVHLTQTQLVARVVEEARVWSQAGYELLLSEMGQGSVGHQIAM